jgi:hypothetical protein
MIVLYATARSAANGPQLVAPIWASPMLLLLMVPAFLAPFGTTILGVIALSQIRRSNGRIYGLGLALFDALFFPLILLGAFIGMLFGIFRLSPIEGFILSIPILVFIAWRISRSVNKPIASSSVANAVAAEPNQPRGVSWKWVLGIGVALMLMAVVIVIVITTYIAISRPAMRREADQNRQSSASVVSGAPFIADYGQGTVELFALALHPSTNGPSWLPNGAPATEKFPHETGKSWSEGKVMKTMAFRIRSNTGTPGSPVLKFTAGVGGMGSSLSGNHSKESGRVFVQDIACPPNVTEMDVEVGIPDGEWEPSITLAATNLYGGTQEGREDGMWEVNFQGVRGKDGAVAISYNFSRNDNYETRMVAVKTDGAVSLLKGGRITSSGGLYHSMVSFTKDEFAEIKDFQLQRRKYEWVTFRNVSLQLGHRTVVQISDRRQGTGQPAQQSGNQSEPGVIDNLQHLFSRKSKVPLAQDPQQIRVLPTAEIIQVGLSEPELPWAWQELKNRGQRGQLRANEVETLLVQITKLMRTRSANDSPLNFMESMLSEFNDRHLIKESQVLDFVQAYHGDPTFDRLPRLRETSAKNTISVMIDWRSQWHSRILGFDMLNDLTSVTIDGRPVAFRIASGSYTTFPMCQGEVNLPPLSPGKHLLKCEITSALIAQENTVGLGSNVPSEDWPPAKRRWTRVAQGEIEVFAKDAEIVQLINDPALSPVNSRSIFISQVIIRSAGKKGKALHIVNFGQNPLKVPVCFDVILKIDGKSYTSSWFLNDATRTGGSTEGSADIDLPSSDIKTCDVILRPKIAAAEEHAGIDRIWGQEITFTNVPLVRHDMASK